MTQTRHTKRNALRQTIFRQKPKAFNKGTKRFTKNKNFPFSVLHATELFSKQLLLKQYQMHCY